MSFTTVCRVRVASVTKVGGTSVLNVAHRAAPKSCLGEKPEPEKQPPPDWMGTRWVTVVTGLGMGGWMATNQKIRFNNSPWLRFGNVYSNPIFAEFYNVFFVFFETGKFPEWFAISQDSLGKLSS